MRAERPERVLVGAQLAEVEPVGVDVVDLAELAAVGDLLQLRDARVVLEQVPDHQRAPGGVGRGDRALGVRDGLRERLLDEAVLAGRRARARRARRGSAPGVASTTASSAASASRSSSDSVRRARGSVAPTRSSAAGVAVAQPGQLAAGEGREVAGEVRAPVAEPGHADVDRGHAPILRASAATTRSPGAAVAVQRRPLGGRRALQRARRPRPASRSTSTFQPASTVSVHSVAAPQRHARHAGEVGLLLHAAGVGQHGARVVQQRGEVEVAERRRERRRRREPLAQAGGVEPRRGARVQRQHDRVRHGLEQRDEPLEPRAGRRRCRRGARSRARTRRAPRRSARAPRCARRRAGRAAARRRPSRRRRPRSRRRRPRRAGSRPGAVEEHSSRSLAWSVSTRLSSSGIVRSYERMPASTCATGIPACAAASAPASVEFVSP